MRSQREKSLHRLYLAAASKWTGIRTVDKKSPFEAFRVACVVYTVKDSFVSVFRYVKTKTATV